jgi:hypothetical protein
MRILTEHRSCHLFALGDRNTVHGLLAFRNESHLSKLNRLKEVKVSFTKYIVPEADFPLPSRVPILIQPIPNCSTPVSVCSLVVALEDLEEIAVSWG